MSSPSWMRFQLRTVFVVITIFGIVFGTIGTWSYRRFRRRQAVHIIREEGGIAVQSREKQIVRVHLQGDQFDDDLLNSLIPHLCRLPNLRELDLVECPVTDKSLRELYKVRRLSELYLLETDASDKGTAQLQELAPNLVIKHEAPDPVASGLASANIYRHAITAFAFHNGDSSLARRPFVTGSGDGVLRLWSGNPSRLPKKIAAHSDWLFAAKLSADNRMLATGGGDSLIKLWDPVRGNLTGQITGHNDDVHALVFSIDGQTLFSAGDDRTVRRTRIAPSGTQASPTSVLGSHDDTIPCLALHGNTVASGSRDDTIGLWNIQGGSLGHLKGHTDDVMCLAFFPDGEMLASGSYDGTVRIWDVETKSTIDVIRGSVGRVHTLAIGADCNLVAIGGENGLSLWDRRKKTSRYQLPEYKNVSCVRIDSASQSLAFTDASGCIQFSDLNSGDVIRRYSTTRYAL